MRLGFSQELTMFAGSITRRGFARYAAMMAAGYGMSGVRYNSDYLEGSKMQTNKLDTAINCASIGGQQLITLPCLIDFSIAPTVQQVVFGWGHFIGAAIDLDTNSVKTQASFGILKSIAITLYSSVEPNPEGPSQFLGKFWIVNNQTQQVICIVPSDPTYLNAANGANTLSKSTVIDLVPSSNAKITIYQEIMGTVGTVATGSGSINLNNFHLST